MKNNTGFKGFSESLLATSKKKNMLKKHFMLLALLCYSLAASAQLVCQQQDREKALEVLKKAKAEQWPALPAGELLVNIGKEFLGKPYVAHTLETDDDEPLVVNLRGLDCTTYLESVVALGLAIMRQDFSFKGFTAALEQLRYREGTRSGYASRLHYFSEWLHSNEQKGLVEQVTASAGGVAIDKPLNFMSTHRDSYAQLASDAHYRQIVEMEKQLQGRQLVYLPKDKIAENEHLVQHGDLVALATTLKGLDVVHVGFAVKQNGRLHLMHASTGSMKVEISEKPLTVYMKDKKIQSGIMLGRVLRK